METSGMGWRGTSAASHGSYGCFPVETSGATSGERTEQGTPGQEPDVACNPGTCSKVRVAVVEYEAAVAAAVAVAVNVAGFQTVDRMVKWATHVVAAAADVADACAVGVGLAYETASVAGPQGILSWGHMETTTLAFEDRHMQLAGDAGGRSCQTLLVTDGWDAWHGT